MPSTYLKAAPAKDPAALDNLESKTMRQNGLLSDVQVASLEALHADLSVFTDTWVEIASRLLETLRGVAGVELVLLTNSELPAALVKCLLFRLVDFFPCANIYSSAKTGKDHAIAAIKQRFGDKAAYVSYGDGPEEERASQKHGIPFKKIVTTHDLRAITRIAERRNGQL